MIYYGNGGFTWSDVMDMPIWMRTFYIKEINKAHESKKKQQEKQQRSRSSRGIDRPSFNTPKSG